MNDVMLDLETMGTDPNAAIIAIGAVEFDIESQKIGEKFYSVIDLSSAVDGGGVIDPETVLWWMEQSSQARAAFARTGQPMAEALRQFSGWLENRSCPTKDIRIWGNGAAFDNVILASAYRRLKLPLPWKFWNDRCYRTVRALYPDVPAQRTGTHHNAVDDAETQALHLIAMMLKS